MDSLRPRVLLASFAAFVAMLAGMTPVAAQRGNGMIDFQVTDAAGRPTTFCVYLTGYPFALNPTGYLVLSTGDQLEVTEGSWSVLFAGKENPGCEAAIPEYAEIWHGDAAAQVFTTPVEVVSGQTATVRAKLTPPAVVSGTLVAANPETQSLCESGVELRARRVEPPSQFLARAPASGDFADLIGFADDGRAALELPAGEYQITMRCGGRAITPTPDAAVVSLAPGDELGLALPVAKAASLQVQLHDLRTAMPVGEHQACIDLLNADGTQYDTFTTAFLAIPFGGQTSGEWQTLVPDGEYLLRLRDCAGHGLQPQYFGSSITVLGAEPITMAGEPAVVAFGVAGRGQRCHGRLPTHVGGPGDDELIGTDGDDVILGLGGDDTILGGAGNDVICAGPGDDYVDGGTGHDQIYGQRGNDELHGGNGIDRISGGPGDDSLYGERGVDKLMGGAGGDLLDGGDKRDIADYRLAPAGVAVYLIESVGGNGEARGDTYVSIEKVAGSAFDDWLVGDNNNNVLIGWSGTDTINGHGGTDVCRGEIVSNCERE